VSLQSPVSSLFCIFISPFQHWSPLSSLRIFALGISDQTHQTTLYLAATDCRTLCLTLDDNLETMVITEIYSALALKIQYRDMD